MCSECEGDACVRERECGRCVIYFGERDPLVRFFFEFSSSFLFTTVGASCPR